jgi:hypothetical protein
MKSSAPQTTMRISFAETMITPRPPEGAETQTAIYNEAKAKAVATGAYIAGKKQFCDGLRSEAERKGSTLQTGMFIHKGRDQRFYWESK